MASPSSDDEYEIPLRDQRYFGAGIKRKRIHFVPSTSNDHNVTAQRSSSPASAANRYLSIVLKDQKKPRETVNDGAVDGTWNTNRLECEGNDHATETVPRQKLSKPSGAEQVSSTQGVGRSTSGSKSPSYTPIHPASTTPVPCSGDETSLTYQIRLPHSHPPSHVDRSRLGLSVLARQGWDPDSRRGLGVSGEGLLYPIKAKENPARAGLGVRMEDLEEMEKKAKQHGVIKLDAGAIRRLEKADRMKAGKLRDQFYRSQDLEKYLGDDAGIRTGITERTSNAKMKWR